METEIGNRVGVFAVGEPDNCVLDKNGRRGFEKVFVDFKICEKQNS